MVFVCYDCRFRNRKPIADFDPHYLTAREEDDSQSMLIPETYREDAAWYMCRATNVAGTATTEAQLQVECEYHRYYI